MPRPVIDHDTRALMAAIGATGMPHWTDPVIIARQAAEVVVVTDALIAALGYQVMAPSVASAKEEDDG